MANNSVENSEKITKPRENNYDLLRIISTFAVILIHVNAFFIYRAADHSSVLYWVESAINIVTRFSVPCFVMLSGAFLLSNPKNKDYKTFYKKSFTKIFLPFIAVSVLLFPFAEINQLKMGGSLLAPIINIVTGNGYYNLWFMFMLFGLYIFVPIIIREKESISNKSYCVVAVIWLLFAILNQLTTIYSMSYAFGVVFSYMGYFIIGNVIHENISGKKNPVLFLALSMICFSITFAYRFFYKVGEIAYDPFSSFFSPFIVLASLLIFIAFGNIKINRCFAKLSSRTFYIYMFHTIIFKSLLSLIGDKIKLNPIVTILLVTVVTFIFAWLVSIAFMKIWKVCDRKIKRIFDKTIFK